MPVYRVKLADGHTYRIESATELSDADVYAQAQNHHNENPPPPTRVGTGEMTHQPNLTDSPMQAAAKEMGKFDLPQTGRDIGRYLKGVVTGPGEYAKNILSDPKAALSSMFEPVNPVTAASTVMNAIKHPSAPNVGVNMENISKLQDPSIIGKQVGTAAAMEGIPRVLGATGRAVAASPVVQKTLGGVGGAAAGASVGHPYIGFGLGSKYGGDIVGGAAKTAGKVQSLSQLLEAGGGPAAEEARPGFSHGPTDTSPIDVNAPLATDQSAAPAPRQRQSTAAPTPMPEHTPGFTPEAGNPKTQSSGSLPAAGARNDMLKSIFGGEDLTDVLGPKGVQRRPLPAGMRKDYPPDIKGDYSNYPQEFQQVTGGGENVPTSAGNEGDLIRKSWMAEHAPESAAQLKTAAEPRNSVQGLDKAVGGSTDVPAPGVAPTPYGAAETPFDDDLARLRDQSDDMDLPQSWKSYVKAADRGKYPNTYSK
jgi:hypothetical protein